METLGFIFAIGAAMTWGLVYAIDEKILANVSPMTLLFVGSVLATIILLPFVFFSNGSIKELLTSGKTNLWLILLSVILAIIADFLILSGIKHLNASIASIIEIAYPFFVVLFGFIFFRSVPNLYFFLGGALIFIGSFIIIRFS